LSGFGIRFRTTAQEGSEFQRRSKSEHFLGGGEHGGEHGGGGGEHGGGEDGGEHGGGGEDNAGLQSPYRGAPAAAPPRGAAAAGGPVAWRPIL
jgi:hypothetical protein